VYAPIYYGYGAPGEYAARSDFARHMEERLVGHAPDFIHVLVKASPEVIAARMDENPHQNPLVPKKDIKKILKRFEEEFEASTMLNKIAIDTSASTVEESLAEFVEKVAPVLNDRDRTAMLVKKAEKAGDWP
jgi:thymidylate kinase